MRCYVYTRIYIYIFIFIAIKKIPRTRSCAVKKSLLIKTLKKMKTFCSKKEKEIEDRVLKCDFSSGLVMFLGLGDLHADKHLIDVHESQFN